jgi:hypothetical protein
VLSFAVLSLLCCGVLLCRVVVCIILSCLVLSYSVLFCSVLFCSFLSCLVLSLSCGCCCILSCISHGCAHMESNYKNLQYKKEFTRAKHAKGDFTQNSPESESETVEDSKEASLLATDTPADVIVESLSPISSISTLSRKDALQRLNQQFFNACNSGPCLGARGVRREACDYCWHSYL